MESAGYIGDIDEWEELFVGTAFQVAEAFAKVDVEESFVLDGAHGSILKIQFKLDPQVTASSEVKAKVCIESLVDESARSLLL